MRLQSPVVPAHSREDNKYKNHSSSPSLQSMSDTQHVQSHQMVVELLASSLAPKKLIAG